MKKKKKGFHAVCLLIFIIGNTQAQNAFVASGGDGSDGTVVISYTIGQNIFNSVSESTVDVLQGIQQAFEVSTLSVDDNILNVELLAYPNPTTDYLTLTVQDFKDKNLRYSVYNLKGVLLKTKPLEDETNRIDFKSFPQGVYALKIALNNKQIKVFRIIKK